MEITVKIKNVYSNELVYPACNTSQAIVRITGRKTLSRNDIEVLKGIGWTIKVEAPQL